jgi:hypothetical protein
MRKLYLLVFLTCLGTTVNSQTMLTDVIDTTSPIGKGFLSLYEKYNWLRFSGYLQPQWQYAETPGAPSFNGGDFASGVDNRFSLRRGRMRIDYQRIDEEGYPMAQLVFQFDGTERGFFARDYWGRVFENRFHAFSLTGGMFARPFGYELNLGSGDRESPERGRASQLLMRVERDLGAMFTIEPRKKGGKFHWWRTDIALVNGQGLNATTDYDSHKDIVVRSYSKPQTIGHSKWQISGGLSMLHGGIVSNMQTVYQDQNGMMIRDSSETNIGRLMPRKYYGADAQLKIPNAKGFTELRAEFLFGDQTGNLQTSETPTALTAPLVSRRFDAAYFYFLQHLGSTKHQIIVKYDWYDPNTDAAGNSVSTANGHTVADVKFSTIGAGYLWYVNPYLRLMLYYEHPMNEETAIASRASDIRDDNFTARLQFRF